MKSVSVILALGLITVAQAQEQCAAVAAQIPECAISCIAAAASGAGCGETDFACQCEESQRDAIASSALPCVVSGCGAVTGLAVRSSAAAVCECAATAAPASTAVSTTAETTEALATSEAAVSTTAEITEASATSEAATTVVATTSAILIPTTSPPYPTASTATAPTGTAGVASPSGAGPDTSATPFTGGAGSVVASISALLLGIAAVIVAL